jgi:transducin (beta)-like 1
MTSAPILISADEVNCLIYSYLQDSGKMHSIVLLRTMFHRTSSGFVHSAFTIRNEGRLDHSPNFGKHIPRGELVELLSKALLYMEVEAHWRGTSLTANCKTGFSLLDSHVCSLDPHLKPTVVLSTATASPIDKQTAPARLVERYDLTQKRKASTPLVEELRNDKRQRKDAEAASVVVEPAHTVECASRSILLADRSQTLHYHLTT